MVRRRRCLPAPKTSHPPRNLAAPMGWERLVASLEALFADAWSRGLIGAATDLAWSVATLGDPAVTVTPALRRFLDLVDAEPPDGSGAATTPPETLEALAIELRRILERHARLEEPAARYARG